MMLLKKNRENIKRLRNDFNKRVETIKYWDKIEKIFIKHRKENVKSFEYDFKHKDDFDNESKIESIAPEYGYRIVDEKLGAFVSKYKFNSNK